MKVLLFKEHQGDPLCAAIAALTRGQYTHAAMLVNEPLTIIEAFMPAVRQRLLSPSELSGIDVFDVDGLVGGRELGAAQYLDAHLGDPYYIKGLFEYLPWFRKMFGDGNEEAAATHHFCSMLVFQALQAAGLTPLARVEPWVVCPNLLSYSPLLIPAPALSIAA